MSQVGSVIIKKRMREEGVSMKQNVDNSDLKYQEILILAYFKSRYKRYNFNQLTQLMGMTYSEMEKSIEHLLGLGYLVCINGYVVIAKIGEKLLEEKNMRNFFINDENKGLKKEVLDIYETYIPIGFEW